MMAWKCWCSRVVGCNVRQGGFYVKLVWSSLTILNAWVDIVELENWNFDPVFFCYYDFFYSLLFLSFLYIFWNVLLLFWDWLNFQELFLSLFRISSHISGICTGTTGRKCIPCDGFLVNSSKSYFCCPFIQFCLSFALHQSTTRISLLFHCLQVFSFLPRVCVKCFHPRDGTESILKSLFTFSLCN